MTVAGARPYDALSLLDEPLWRVLWTYHHLMELRTLDRLVARADRVDQGMMVGMGVNEPKLLADELRNVQAAIREQTEGPVVRTTALATGRALVERIRRGRVLEPGALVS